MGSFYLYLFYISLIVVPFFKYRIFLLSQTCRYYWSSHDRQVMQLLQTFQLKCKYKQSTKEDYNTEIIALLGEYQLTYLTNLLLEMRLALTESILCRRDDRQNTASRQMHSTMNEGWKRTLQQQQLATQSDCTVCTDHTFTVFLYWFTAKWPLFS